MKDKWFLPLILWSLLILFLTWYQQIEAPDLGFDAQDKAAHFLVFFVLGFLSCRAFSKYEIKRRPRTVYHAVLFGVAFACIDEFVQLWIPGRYFDLLDGLFNILGVLTAALTFERVLPLLKKHRMLW